MKRRNRAWFVIGLVVMLLGWLAWKTLHTASTLPSARPVAQDQAR